MYGGGDKTVSVTLANVAATIKSESNTQVVVQVKDSTAAKGDVVLTADSGATVTSASDAWTYVTNGVIAKVEPNAGQERSPVTITGTRLLGGGKSAAKVLLAGLEAEVDTSTASKVTVFAARSPKTQKGDIIIVSDSGAVVTAKDVWTYFEPGVIKSVAPATGQFKTIVTIVGERLLASGKSADRKSVV